MRLQGYKKHAEALRDFPYKVQFALLVVLNAIDVALAVYSSKRLHPIESVDLDPILTSIVSNPPIYFALAFICAVQLILLLCIRAWVKTRRTLFKKSTWNIVCAIYALIVTWNTWMVAATIYLEAR